VGRGLDLGRAIRFTWTTLVATTVGRDGTKVVESGVMAEAQVDVTARSVSPAIPEIEGEAAFQDPDRIAAVRTC